jgi:O-methyltransferase
MKKFIKTFLLPSVLRRIRRDRLTYLSVEKLWSLAAEVERLKRDKVRGDFVEFGVALGGASIYLAKKAEGRRFIGFDVFGTIPPPGEQDGNDSHRRYETIAAGRARGLGSGKYYGYQENLYEIVVANFARYDLFVDQLTISLKRGLFEQTVCFTDEDQIALAHIDCDWFEPVKFCIEKVAPRLAVGGVLIIDDYNDYLGCRRAVHEALEKDSLLKLVCTSPHAVIRRC